MRALLACLLVCACARTPVPVAAPASPEPAGGVDLTILDRKVDPCQDFYQFACGGWLATTEIPSDEAMWGRGFESLGRRNELVLQELLEAAAAKPDAEPEAVKLGAYYASCMDEAATAKHAPAALAAQRTRLNKVRDARSLAAALGELQAQGAGALFSFGSSQDGQDATQIIGTVAQGGLGLPDRDFYSRADEHSQKIVTAYQEHVSKMLALAGVSGAPKKAARVVALEKRLAGSHFTNVELRDPRRIYNRVELAGLEKLAPRFAWTTYLASMGRGDVTAINVTTPKNVEAIGKLVGEIPMTEWRVYLLWWFIESHAGALGKTFEDERFRFGSRYIHGAKELPPRWRRCVAATGAAMSHALGRQFVQRRFRPEAKVSTRQMVADLEQAFGKRVDGLDWMDDPTRAAAHAKLTKIANKVGYPDEWRRYDKLEVKRDDYLANRLASNAFENQRDLTKIGKPLDRREWTMDAPEVNAAYDPQKNDVTFPAGILQPPFYDPAASAAVNFGALGLIVGHELTHGFDDEGRQFDADGNLRDWWSDKVARTFTERAHCLVDQYKSYVAIDDVHVDGELTLGENIADLGGLSTSYAAYQTSRSGKPAAPAVAGFDDRQQFFLGAAQAWCTKATPQVQRTLAQTDPHSPERYRVNGPLSNMPEFAAAFQCKEGAPMSRPQRCRVW